MARAIVDQSGSSIPIYRVRYDKRGSPFLADHRIVLEDGDTKIDASKGAIILLDWVGISNDEAIYGTGAIASLFFDYLFATSEQTNGHFLSELPLHFIGHSRGASLNSALIYELAYNGILVDHVTTLDPHPSTVFPAAGDWPMRNYQNVLFADNYWRTGVLPQGYEVPGSFNVNLDEEFDGAGAPQPLTVLEHQAVHTYYYGTMNTTAGSDGEATILNLPWYTSRGITRETTGYAYSRYAHRVIRDFDGVNQFIAGARGRGNRESIESPLQLWPNVGFDQRTAAASMPASIMVGQSIDIPYFFADRKSEQTITFFLDSDTDPYNGTERELGSATKNSRPGGSIGSAAFSWTPIMSDTGTHFIGIKTTNTKTDVVRVRYDYYLSPIVIAALPPPPVDDHGSSSAQSTALTLGAPVSGFISSPTDADWFKVEVSAAGVLSFDLSVPAGKDYDLELFGPDGNYISGSYGDTGAAESLSQDIAVANIGTYYVRVYGYPVGNGSFSGTESYSLVANGIFPSDGSLASGGACEGTITSGATNTWTIGAVSGDSLAIRMGELTGSSSFSPDIRLYDPTGSQVQHAWGWADAMVTHRATITGTYTIVVSSNNIGETGTYRLHVVKAPGAIIVPSGDDGGPLTNGGAYDGAITMGDLDAWTIDATNGDSLMVRMGELTGSSSFSPDIRLYDPTGLQVQHSWGWEDAMVTHRATVTGRYTVIVSSNNVGETGTYRLHVVKAPGSFVVPNSDEGGSMLNGGAYEGAITMGDLDAWTIDATSGDSLVLRMGELTGSSSFSPDIRLYDPMGLQVQHGFGWADTLVTHRATVTGRYTVVVSSNNVGETGTYRLHVVKAPGVFTVSTGDEGGPLTNGSAHEGMITMGDLDAWTIDATSGDSLVVRMGELTGSINFSPDIRLYDPTGLEVQHGWGWADALVTHRATVTGRYTVVVSSNNVGETGTYRLHVIKAPGTLVIPTGDEGGPLTNGGAYEGAITMGDLDGWTIDATSGDSLVVRIVKETGSSNFSPDIRLYDPAGLQVQHSWDWTDAKISHHATVTGRYTVVVSSNNSGETGTYRLDSLPIITTQPVSRSVTLGTAVSFVSAASGAPAPTFQWQKNGVNINGANSATYSIASVVAGDVGNYRVVATNSTGFATSSVATLTIIIGGSIPAGFDVQGYLTRYPDVAAIFGADLYGAWLYYRDYGIYQGQFYDELFRVEEYLALYPELFALFGNDLGAALEHWLSTGRLEGKLGRIPLEFSAQGYFSRNPDVAAAVGGNTILAWGHYWLYGIYEGRAYDDELRVFEYLAINADLTAAFVNDWRTAALHWMRYGRTEGRLGRLPLIFSSTEYLVRNPDVAATWGTNPTTDFLHFWLYGINEGRTFDNFFRVDEYLALNPDLSAIFGTDRRGAFKHWVRYGQAEGRLGRNP